MSMRKTAVVLATLLAAALAQGAFAQAPPASKKPPAATPVPIPGAVAVKPKPQANPADAARRKARFEQLVRERERAGQDASAKAVLPAARQPLAPAGSSLQRKRAAAPAMVFSSGTDCDDSRADVHPGASETCDGRDNNCNGQVDEGQTLRFFLDADGDGHGDPQREVNACPADQSRARNDGAWLVLVGNDCDDGNPDAWRDCP